MAEAELAFGDENPIAKKIREFLGVGDYEAVTCILPDFERTDGRITIYVPVTTEEYDSLKKAPNDVLKNIGVQQWNEEIWLFPKEWYDYIPEGYEVVDIFGETEKFQKGETDDDIRFGALSFGFRKAVGEPSGD